MSDQPEALRVADELEALRVSDAREMWLLGEPAARLLREQHAEIQELREANETFGKRQEWWNEKMFDMELEVERLREQLRLANIDALNETAENEALRAAVLAEREACAQVCDLNAEVCNNNSMLRDVLMGNAAAIRARGFDVPDA